MTYGHELLDDDLSQARKMLAMWEREKEHITRCEYFKKAMILFNDYLEDFPESPNGEYVSNVTCTYTRALLEELPFLHRIDMTDWIQYLDLLLLVKPCSDNVCSLTENSKRLQQNLRQFLGIWMDELKRLQKPK